MKNIFATIGRAAIIISTLSTCVACGKNEPADNVTTCDYQVTSDVGNANAEPIDTISNYIGKCVNHVSDYEIPATVHEYSTQDSNGKEYNVLEVTNFNDYSILFLYQSNVSIIEAKNSEENFVNPDLTVNEKYLEQCTDGVFSYKYGDTAYLILPDSGDCTTIWGYSPTTNELSEIYYK